MRSRSSCENTEAKQIQGKDNAPTRTGHSISVITLKGILLIAILVFSKRNQTLCTSTADVVVCETFCQSRRRRTLHSFFRVTDTKEHAVRTVNSGWDPVQIPPSRVWWPPGSREELNTSFVRMAHVAMSCRHQQWYINCVGAPPARLRHMRRRHERMSASGWQECLPKWLKGTWERKDEERLTTNLEIKCLWLQLCLQTSFFKRETSRGEKWNTETVFGRYDPQTAGANQRLFSVLLRVGGGRQIVLEDST